MLEATIMPSRMIDHAALDRLPHLKDAANGAIVGLSFHGTYTPYRDRISVDPIHSLGVLIRKRSRIVATNPNPDTAMSDVLLTLWDLSRDDLILNEAFAAATAMASRLDHDEDTEHTYTFHLLRGAGLVLHAFPKEQIYAPYFPGHAITSAMLGHAARILMPTARSAHARLASHIPAQRLMDAFHRQALPKPTKGQKTPRVVVPFGTHA